MEKIFYAYVVTPYAKPTGGIVTFDKDCNSWVIKNSGTTILNFDGEDIQPGESKAIGGNAGEYYNGERKKYYFTVPTPAPLVITNIAYLTQKIYVTKTLS